MVSVLDADVAVDLVVFEHEQTGSYYKQLKTYKLIKLISLHLNSRIGEIKSSVKKTGEEIINRYFKKDSNWKLHRKQNYVQNKRGWHDTNTEVFF